MPDQPAQYQDKLSGHEGAMHPELYRSSLGLASRRNPATPAYLLVACADGRYMTCRAIHVDGGNVPCR